MTKIGTHQQKMIKMDTNGIKIGTMLITSYFYRYNIVSSIVKIGTGVIKIGTYFGGPYRAFLGVWSGLRFLVLPTKP